MTNYKDFNQRFVAAEDTPGKLIVVEREVDLALRTLTASDDIDLVALPANAILQEVAVVVTKADTGASTRTMDIGVSGSEAAFIASFDLKTVDAISKADLSATGLYYAAATTIVGYSDHTLVDGVFVLTVSYIVKKTALT